MKHQSFSLQRRQVMEAVATIALGAGSMATPATLMAAPADEPAVQVSGDALVVSGRIRDDAGGQALAGAQIEIWQADARGVRFDHTREVALTDGDGRYFATLSTLNRTPASRLHYRVSHPNYTARVTQLHTSGAPQRAVTLTRDDTGTTRAAFEMTLAPRHGVGLPASLTSTTPDYVAL